MPTEVTQHRYPCAQCGASLRFQPGQSELVCDYCGHRQRIEGPPPGGALQWDAAHKAPELAEIPLEKGLKLDDAGDLAEDIRTLSCPNCGAMIELDGAQHSGACPFCATPVVTDTSCRSVSPPGTTSIPFNG